MWSWFRKQLDDTFPVDQFVFKGVGKPFRIDRNKNGGGILLFVREDVRATLISTEKAPIESFFIELNLHMKNWIVNVLTITTKPTYLQNWKSSHKIWIFIPLIVIILSFSGISMQILAIKRCLTFMNLTIQKV